MAFTKVFDIYISVLGKIADAGDILNRCIRKLSDTGVSSAEEANTSERGGGKTGPLAIRFIAYTSLAVVLYLTFELFVHLLNFNNLDYLSMHLRRVADALILALPVWFVCRKFPLFVWIGLLVLYLNANLVYYRYYDELIPFSSFRLVGNLDGIGDSILLGIGWGNLFLLILPLLWCVWFGVFRIGTKMRDRGRNSRSRRLLSAGLFFMIGTAIILPSYLVGNKDDYSRPWRLFQFEPLRAYRQFGLINFWIYQTSKLQGVSGEDEASARVMVNDMMAEWKELAPLIPSEDKNLIIILVESLGSWPIGLEVEGEKVTPRLDQIIASDSTVFMSKVVPQVKHGRSSDAQLMINTGLLPLTDGAASSLYAFNSYPALAKALKQKGYGSSLYICDSKKYWNQGATAVAYGIERVYDELASQKKELSDGDLFRKSFQEIRKQKQPFYSMLVTMSGHDPIRGKLKSKFHNMDFATEDARNIVAIVNYTDSCIGAFVDDLKVSGLYDNSIIVVTGDHDGVGRNRFDGREQGTVEDRYIPFIVINVPDGLNADENAIMGQSDIYPSLLDMLGVSAYHWRGVGESIFRPRESGAICRDMSSAGEMTPETMVRRRYAWTLSDILIRMGWFGDENQK